MVVGIGKIDLYLPACHSLKEKRRVLRKLKDRTSNRFKIQLAEVDDQDAWQSAKLGFSLVGNDRRVIQSVMDKVFNFVTECADVQIVDQWSEVGNY
jgi:uncharacterized protein YlxP (DUF503 family)